MSERRRTKYLTPFETEVRDRPHPVEKPPGWFERFRQRQKSPPKTTGGAVVRGLVRLGIAVAAASGIAVLVSHLVGRRDSFGFYVVGAAILGIAFLTSASPMGGRTSYYTSSAGEREQRISWSFAYILAGGIVVAIGVLIDLL